MPAQRNVRCYGVTGSRDPSDAAKHIVGAWVETLPQASTVYHGGCVGIDAIVAQLAYAWGHRVIAVLPAIGALVDCDARDKYSQVVIHAPPGRGRTNDYRARNELLVYQLKAEGGLLKAFWDGSYRSGTKMTMNIAERAGVSVEIGDIK